MARDKKENYEDLENKFYEDISELKSNLNAYIDLLNKDDETTLNAHIDLLNKQEQLRQLQLRNDLLSETIKLRKKIGNAAILFVTIYFTVVFAILFLQGFSNPEKEPAWRRFDLDNPVLVRISGPTAVVVIGLFGVMLRGLYINKEK